MCAAEETEEASNGDAPVSTVKHVGYKVVMGIGSDEIGRVMTLLDESIVLWMQ